MTTRQKLVLSLVALALSCAAGAVPSAIQSGLLSTKVAMPLIAFLTLLAAGLRSPLWPGPAPVQPASSPTPDSTPTLKEIP